MKLSTTLRTMSDLSTCQAHSGALRECSRKAKLLERTLDDDVRDYCDKFGHRAPKNVIDPRPGELDSTELRERCAALCSAMDARSLSDIAGTAARLVYTVVGILVSIGVPLMPFWNDIHRGRMTRIRGLRKPTEPDGWRKPNARAVLYFVRRNQR